MMLKPYRTERLTAPSTASEERDSGFTGRSLVCVGATYVAIIHTLDRYRTRMVAQSGQEVGSLQANEPRAAGCSGGPRVLHVPHAARWPRLSSLLVLIVERVRGDHVRSQEINPAVPVRQGDLEGDLIATGLREEDVRE